MTRMRRFLRIAWNAASDRPQNNWIVNLAAGLVLTPMVMLFPITLQFFINPLWMFEDREKFSIFVMFYATPWVLAGFLVYFAATAGVDKR